MSCGADANNKLLASKTICLAQHLPKALTLVAVLTLKAEPSGSQRIHTAALAREVFGPGWELCIASHCSIAGIELMRINN